MIYDVIIVGEGPAGISASLYTKRANLETLILAKEEGTLQKVGKIENYYGLEKETSGKELQEIGKRQAVHLGVTIKKEEVLQIEYNTHFIVTTFHHTYEAKTVILATGSARKKRDIKGLKELEGKGVSYCAVCDAFLFKGKEVAVLGSKEYAFHEAQVLLPLVKSVTMLTNGEEAIEKRAEGILVEERKIREVRGTDHVTEVAFEDDTTKKIDGVFVAIGTASSSDLARKLGIKLEKTTNAILVNEKMETNLPGLYACGDCTGGTLQIAKAVYEGMVAGMSAIEYVRKGGEKNECNK